MRPVDSFYRARGMAGLGHEPRLIAPRHVKPFVKRHKNDSADAEAIIEAALRPTMRFVPPKNADQQAHGLCSGSGRGLSAGAPNASAR